MKTALVTAIRFGHNSVQDVSAYCCWAFEYSENRRAYYNGIYGCGILDLQPMYSYKLSIMYKETTPCPLINMIKLKDFT